MWDDGPEAAAEAGLRYVSDDEPGIRRVRRGRGFSYVAPDGSVIQDGERERIAAIAIPPAWTDVWISPHPDAHILATGRDDKGRKQYCYHPTWREFRDVAKFEQLGEFGEVLPDLRATLDQHLRRRGLPAEKVIALVVRLLDETLIRIGNQQYAAANESYGLTTLRSEHVQTTSGTALFDFEGKGGELRQVALRDRRLAGLVRQCQEVGGQELFCYRGQEDSLIRVRSDDVNDYLRQVTGGPFTAKHFRTWGGTCTTAQALAGMGMASGEGETESNILAAIDMAAEKLGNTREVCRSSYVHPDIPDAYRSGELLQEWNRRRDGKWMARSERTVQALL